jgi:hypothetical protein
MDVGYQLSDISQREAFSRQTSDISRREQHENRIVALRADI